MVTSPFSHHPLAAVRRAAERRKRRSVWVQPVMVGPADMVHHVDGDGNKRRVVQDGAGGNTGMNT